MAFEQNDFAPIGGQSSPSPAVYSYITNDTIAQVIAADYFLPKQYQMEAGDQVFCHCSDGTTILTYNGVGVASTSILIDSQIIVKTAEDLSGTLRSDVVYFIDGVVDMGNQSITVPATGLSIMGSTFDTSQLVSTEDNYTMFIDSGGAGNLLLSDIALSVSGTSSQVFDLTDVNGNSAAEFNRVNFNGCTSRGEFTDYRQLLENGNGMFGGTPELTLSGSMNGYRVLLTIVRGISNITSLYKTGTSLTFDGRFIVDINCDLPASGALIDFSESNITNNESLLLENCFITRSGSLNASDSGISPNIDQTSLKSNWSINTGVPNTVKFIRSECSTEVETTISTTNTFEILLGTFSVDTNVHFDMPANGQFRLQTGFGAYQISGNLVIDGPQNDDIAVRITKSSDDGVTFPAVIASVQRTINQLSGPRNIATVPITAIASIDEDERLRLEIENRSSTGNLTMEVGSAISISQV